MVKPIDSAGVDRGSVAAATPCVACGYDLVGTTLGGTCPECGASAKDTWTVVGDGATLRQLVTVALRLAAVYLALNSFFTLETLVWMVGGLVMGQAAPTSPPGQWAIAMWQLTPVLLRLGAIIGLWWLAPRLARGMVANEVCVTRNTLSSAPEFLSVGLMLIGVYFVVTGLTALFSQGLLEVLLLIRPAEMPDWKLDARWGQAVSLVAGVVLVGSARVRAWLGRGLAVR